MDMKSNPTVSKILVWHEERGWTYGSMFPQRLDHFYNSQVAAIVVASRSYPQCVIELIEHANTLIDPAESDHRLRVSELQLGKIANYLGSVAISLEHISHAAQGGTMLNQLRSAIRDAIQRSETSSHFGIAYSYLLKLNKGQFVAEEGGKVTWRD